ncbi:MAG: HAMP domain-containing protein, partial [Planctomycetaceae bacterium]
MMKTRSQLLHQLTGPSAFWRTLRFQFALWVAVLLFVTQIALGAYIYLALEDRLLDAIDDTLRLNAAQITGLIELQEGQIILAEAERDRPLSEELEEQSLTARILDPSGNVVQAYGIYRNVSVPQQSRGLGQQPRERLLTIPDPFDEDALVLVFTTPIERQGQVIGTLEVMQSLDSIEEALEQLLTLLELGLLLSIPAAALGGYGLASRALGRVDRIAAMARRTSARDLSARLNFPRTNDEVGRLAQTFDMML